MAFGTSDKQLAIMKAVQAGGSRGPGHITMNELLENLPYKTSKESLQCSLRILDKQDLVKTHDYVKIGRYIHRVLALTEDGYVLLKYRLRGH